MEDCIFCKIVKGEAPATILHESQDAVIIPDIRPSAPVHYLVIPKRHIASVADTSEEDAVLLGHLITMARKGAELLGLTGYKLVFNVGPEGGQIVGHIHLHILGGWGADEPKKISV